MNMREDFIMIIRVIRKRPVESLLLILGISLGIGATASGISIVAQTVKESRALLNETRFREIRVAARESAAQMDLPADQVVSGEDIILTAGDLVARNDVPAVEYAYVANRDRLHFGNFSFNGRDNNNVRHNNNSSVIAGNTGGNNAGNAGNPAGDTTGGQQTAPRTDGQPAPGADNQPATGANGAPPWQPGANNGGPGGPNFFFNPEDEPALPEGPQPTVEELDGYQVSDEYFPAYNLAAAQGSLFTAADIRKGESLLILGSEIGQTMFEDGQALNRQVIIRRQLFTITGILAPTGTDLDLAGFIPVFMPNTQNIDPRLRFINWGTNLRFTVRNSDDLVAAKAQLSAWFDQTYGQGRVAISIPREQAEELTDRNNRLVTIILILAISGLLIASVNVSNILYSRAIRKRKAIGILKALGATRLHVFTLFFTEAVIIGIGGALFGSCLAAFLSKMMQTSLGIGGYSLGILGVGVLLSLATTLFLTNIPAMQTSKIPPSEAIRYE